MRSLISPLVLLLVAPFCLLSGAEPPGAAAKPAGGGTFHVRIDGRPVSVEKFREISFVAFSIERPVQVKVQAPAAIKEFNLSPHAARIDARAQGNVLTFALDRPRQLALTVNGAEHLFLFAEAPAPPPSSRPGGIIDVRTFGVDATGRTLETTRLQQAIDKVASEKGTLYFPPGTYLSGTLSLKSGLTLHLAEGARLMASNRVTDFPQDPGTDESTIRYAPDIWQQRQGLDVSYRRFLLVDNAKNVRVEGRGIIEGRGRTLMGGATSRSVAGGLNSKPVVIGRDPTNINFILVRQSSHVVFEGITLLDSPMYNAHVLASDHVTFRNVKVVADTGVPNTDGINPDSSRDILIEGCFLYSTDDCVSIKTSGQSRLKGNSERIVVRNCVFISRTSAAKFGNETWAGVMRDITFENNDVLEADRAFVLSCMDGNYFENLRFIDNRVERLIGRRVQFPIHVHVRQRHPQGGAGRIHNVLFENLSVEQEYPSPSLLAGLSAEHDVRGIRFVNYTIAGRLRLNAADANVDIGPFVSDVTFTGPGKAP